MLVRLCGPSEPALCPPWHGQPEPRVSLGPEGPPCSEPDDMPISIFSCLGKKNPICLCLGPLL